MRIALAVFSLEAGGAERVLSLMANHWSLAGHEVVVVTLESSSKDFYALDPGVHRVAHGETSSRSNVVKGSLTYLRWIRWLRRSFRTVDPQVTVSFLDKMNLLVLLATMRLKFPVVVSERIDPEMQPLPAGLDLIRKPLYRRAGRVVVQTERAAAWARRFVSADRIRVISNPVTPPIRDAKGKAPLRLDRPCLVAAGRLDHQKGFDLLLQSFALTSPQHPDWSLVIFGKGPGRNDLEELRDALGLSERVEMPGVVRDLPAVLSEADLFVLSSRWEGFPNALLEAMAAGLAVVSFDCRSGPREIITDGEDGVLVPPEDVNALARAIDRLMSDASERRRLGEHARRVGERFALDKVMAMWDDVVDDVVGTK
jgi:GalNAc-alpha-(1->4)-GalNAc-alpha-(1->3)-diNAcBac-PP-undecaprenol alpha-1,4-N-acetyl-D-galactosaminyltransferase